MANNLKLHGATVTTATNAHEAWKLIEQTSFDAIVSDVRMPEGDGVSLLKTLREKYPKPPPFFFVTGYADHTPEEFAEMGATETLSKPFGTKVLVEVLLKYLKK